MNITKSTGQGKSVGVCGHHTARHIRKKIITLNSERTRQNSLEQSDAQSQFSKSCTQKCLLNKVKTKRVTKYRSLIRAGTCVHESRAIYEKCLVNVLDSADKQVNSQNGCTVMTTSSTLSSFPPPASIVIRRVV